MIESIAAQIGIHLAMQGLPNVRTKIATAVRNRRERKRRDGCSHVIVHDHELGAELELSTTPVNLFEHRCWQCGGVAPRAAFRHHLNELGKTVARSTGQQWKMTD